MADSCASNLDTNCIALWRVCYTKKHVLNQSLAALRRSIGLLGLIHYCMEKRELDTLTPNYCNPAVHAHRGWIMNILLFIATIIWLQFVHYCVIKCDLASTSDSATDWSSSLTFFDPVVCYTHLSLHAWSNHPIRPSKCVSQFCHNMHSHYYIRSPFFFYKQSPLLLCLSWIIVFVTLSESLA